MYKEVKVNVARYQQYFFNSHMALKRLHSYI